MRYWIRSNILKALHWDDAAHLLGLLCLLAQVSMNTAGDVAGTHAQWDVDYDGDDSARWEKLVSFSTRANFAANLLTWCCLYSIKAAFLLLYRQIFHISKPFMRVWWIVSIVVFATWCVLFVGSLVQCGDISNPNQESMLLETFRTMFDVNLMWFSEMYLRALYIPERSGQYLCLRHCS